MTNYISLAARRLASRIKIVQYALLRRDHICIVYQMGKVGSSTICEALERQNFVYWHIHRLFDTELWSNKPKNFFLFYLDLIVFRICRFRFKKITYICGVRDPYSRDVSMLFQYLSDKNIPLELASHYFYNNFPIGNCVNWFDEELYRATGTDIFKLDPPHRDGFLHVRLDAKTDIIVYRVENLVKTLGAILKLLGVPSDVSAPANSATQKNYYRVYKEFTLQNPYPPPVADMVKRSKYYKFFYDTKRD